MKNKIKLVLASLAIATSAGCYGTGYGYGGSGVSSYSGTAYNPTPSYQETYTPNYGHHEERQMWRENARVPHFFGNQRQVEQWILDETRGADFNNPRDRRNATIRASQIRERAWREQLRRQGH